MRRTTPAHADTDRALSKRLSLLGHAAYEITPLATAEKAERLAATVRAATVRAQSGTDKPKRRG